MNMAFADVEIAVLSVGELQSNACLIKDRATRQAVLVDPGAEGSRLVEWIDTQDCVLELVVNTHGHGDHIGANQAVLDQYPVPLAIHQADADCLTDPQLNLSALFFLPVTSPPATRLLHDGDKLPWSGPEIVVIETPGHTPGSICLSGEGWLIAGDTLFRASIGRTDLPRSNQTEMFNSLEKLKQLPPDTKVFPGHGPQTTIEYELEHNPFLGNKDSWLYF